MTYEESKKYIDAVFVYVGVPKDQALAVPQNKHFTEVDGVTLLGVEKEIPEFADKLLIAP